MLWPLSGMEENMTGLSQIHAKIIYISVLTFTCTLSSAGTTQEQINSESNDRKLPITTTTISKVEEEKNGDAKEQSSKEEQGAVKSYDKSNGDKKIDCDDILEAAKTGVSTIDSSASTIDNDKNFKVLLTNLRKLKTKGSIAPWCNAINQYMEHSKMDVDLEELQKILLKQSDFTGKRANQVKRAIKAVEKSLEEEVEPDVQEEDGEGPAIICLLIGNDGIADIADIADMGDGCCDEEEAPRLSKKAKAKIKSKAKLDALKRDASEENIPLAKVAKSPIDISSHLKNLIAGQDDALEQISLFAHRFLCNKVLVDRQQSPASKPPHCILTGPTGCGKSETLKQLGKFLNVAVMHVNARSLTDEGYKGTNFSEMVDSFCKANGKPKSAIVAIDELDKLAFDDTEGSKDFGKAVQRVLLSCLDGNPICKEGNSYDISNWWFIGTGAFSGCKGIHDTEKDERSTTARTHEDIIAYGFEPEFCGRFPSIIAFKGHTLETMVSVITREGSPINIAKKEFKLFYNIDLEFEEKALQKLAKASVEVGLGVRSLHTILNEVLPQHYRASCAGLVSDKLVITEKEVQVVIDKLANDKKFKKEELPYPHMYI